MANENFGANFSIDITDLKTGLAQANRLIRESESQFREAAAGMDDWTESSEGLTARTKTLSDQIGIQEKKVAALVASKQEIIDKMKAEGKSISEAALMAGFRDYSSFYRAYQKEYGVSPRSDMGV